MKKEIILSILMWILVAFLGNLAAIWVVRQYDEAWECRAKAAGYYDSLPDNLKNPRDLNGVAK